MDTDLSPQITLQRLLQADREAQERIQQAEEQAQALISQAHEEAQALIEEAREEVQTEPGTIRQSPEAADTVTSPDQAARVDPDQAYRSDPEALRQRAQPALAKAADWLAAWVTGEGGER